MDEKTAHQSLADKCVELMSSSLKQDICGMKDPGALIAQVQRSQIENCLAREVQYACLHWVHHLEKSGAQFRDDDKVHRFLKEHFLHWLEALGWIGNISDGINAINILESIASQSNELVRPTCRLRKNIILKCHSDQVLC